MTTRNEALHCIPHPRGRVQRPPLESFRFISSSSIKCQEILSLIGFTLSSLVLELLEIIAACLPAEDGARRRGWPLRSAFNRERGIDSSPTLASSFLLTGNRCRCQSLRYFIIAIIIINNFQSRIDYTPDSHIWKLIQTTKQHTISDKTRVEADKPQAKAALSARLLQWSLE